METQNKLCHKYMHRFLSKKINNISTESITSGKFCVVILPVLYLSHSIPCAVVDIYTYMPSKTKPPVKTTTTTTTTAVHNPTWGAREHSTYFAVGCRGSNGGRDTYILMQQGLTDLEFPCCLFHTTVRRSLCVFFYGR